MTDKFEVVSYTIADGRAVLRHADGTEHRIDRALGFYLGVKAG